MAAKVDRHMRALKVLVVVMGVALVAGTAALVAALVLRAERGGVGAVASTGPLHAALPAGSRILGSELQGDRLVIHVALASGGEALYLFDARSGAAVAVIEAPSNR
jgi:Family of unknown function (DUF6476)